MILETRGRKPVDVTGQRFGMLVAVARVGVVKGAASWECRCDCGGTVVVSRTLLRKSPIRCCGCTGTQANARPAAARSRHPSYMSWLCMKLRCTDPKISRFRDYGGRGITVHPEWLESFDAFVRDMGTRPSSRHSLDRIDNEGNYEPSNCRWATPREQCQNTRATHNVTWNGETYCITEWARRLGVSRTFVRDRALRGLGLDAPSSAFF